MPEPNPTAIIIGAGVGGLAAAIRLARAGVRVRVLERAHEPGGKLREVEVGGRRFQAGPSVLTMRWVFEELFGGAAQLAERLPLQPLDPLCRHFFADGSVLDLHLDAERSRAAIEAFAGRGDAEAYLRFREHAARIYEIVRGPFMERPVSSVLELLQPKVLLHMPRIDGLRTLWRALEGFFADPRLRQLFARYATYNGSSPFHAPGTLAVIAHVENAGGIWSCEGGIPRLRDALVALAAELGVEVTLGADVEEIVVERGRAAGVRLRGETVRADAVVANCDVAHLYERLLPGVRGVPKLAARYEREELSLSAFLWLVSAPAPSASGGLALAEHNVFFSADYAREFTQLIDERRPPEDPTVYLCELGEERHFFLTNSPPLDGRGAAVDWAAEAPRCRARVLARLARHGWPIAPVAERTLAPPEQAERFPSSRGALYGLASNSRLAAFKRPPNRLPGVERLYLAGGTVHPGAGLPMVCLSARMATDFALSDLGLRDTIDARDP